MARTKFDTLDKLAAYLIRSGFAWRNDYERFERGSFYAYIRQQKNGAYWYECA